MPCKEEEDEVKSLENLEENLIKSSANIYCEILNRFLIDFYAKRIKKRDDWPVAKKSLENLEENLRKSSANIYCEILNRFLMDFYAKRIKKRGIGLRPRTDERNDA